MTPGMGLVVEGGLACKERKGGGNLINKSISFKRHQQAPEKFDFKFLSVFGIVLYLLFQCVICMRHLSAQYFHTRMKRKDRKQN